MAFLDFIKNRGEQRPVAEQQSQQQQPETAKQMYTRESAQEKATAKPISLSQESEGRVAEANALFRRGTEGVTTTQTAPAQEVTDATSNPQPMAQKAMNQDVEAPALTPTSEQVGTRTNEIQGPAQSEDAAAKSQQVEQARQTIARRPPSWER